MPNRSIIASNNEGWGFSIIRSHADLAKAWPLAVIKLEEKTGCSAFGIRDFLDSRHGRHFADDVATNLIQGLPLDAALDAAIDRWMAWRISRHVQREYGIPAGLPYLMGFIMHFEILADEVA